MLQKQKADSANAPIILLLVLINALILKVSFVQHKDWYWALIITLPLLLWSIYTRHAHASEELKQHYNT